jgi:ATPase subunit of ABC transporter with duplicated ATPase domains
MRSTSKAAISRRKGRHPVGRRTQPRPHGQTVEIRRNVLLLDEPINDASVNTARSNAIVDFRLRQSSPRRFFLDRICTHISSFEGGLRRNSSTAILADYRDKKSALDWMRWVKTDET